MVASLIQDTLTFLHQHLPTNVFLSDETRDFFLHSKKTIKKPPPTEKPVISSLAKKDSPKETSPPKGESQILPSPKKPRVSIQKPKSESWDLEKTHQNKEINFSYLEQQIKKALPDLLISEKILSDHEAKKIANRWKWMEQLSPITILSTTPHIKEKQFLHHLAKAIELYFLPCRVINPIAFEKENQWKNVLDPSQIKFVISCDYEIWSLKNLVPYLRKIPQEQNTYLGDIPILLLPDLKVYFRDSSLKRSLWKTLCQKLPASS